MRKFGAVVLVACSIQGAASFAATDDGQYANYAVGAQPCSAVLQAYQQNDQSAVLLEVSSWLSGYISAMNRVSEETYDVTPIMNHASLTMLTLRICENNPDQLYESVVNAALSVLAPLRSQEEVGGVQIERDGLSITLRENSIKALQVILAEKGLLDEAAADGVFGDMTAKAISTWQNDNGLQVTGLFDPVTVFSLVQKAE